ncbi:MAG: hypothetical protein GY778_20575 [bacterium]|nr:hypothetical protein [bacterium]
MVWVHAASVGEALTAAPIVQRLRAAAPSLQTVLSYSSPSMATWPGSLGTDHADYIPLDERQSIGRVLDAVRPSLIVFARGDLWPEFVAETADRGIPITVIGATVRPGSHRLDWPTRQMLERVHRSVSWVGAVSEHDGARYVTLGVPRTRIDVTGDPRHDQVLERVVLPHRLGGLLEWARERVVLVAGSVDRVDTRIVLDAFAAVSRSTDGIRLLLVPHEPNPRNVTKVIQQASEHGFGTEPWDNGARAPEAPCVVVTKVGALADLYAIGDIAYVGGGYRRGVHAVAEPAAYAIPAVMGPRHEASPDAVRMVEGGGAVTLPGRDRAADALANVCLRWASHPADRAAAGLSARRVVTAGAAATSATALLRFLGSGR